MIRDPPEWIDYVNEFKEHEGSAFFPLPDGSAILYRLWGTAEAPAAFQPSVSKPACACVFGSPSLLLVSAVLLGASPAAPPSLPVPVPGFG